MSDSWDPMDCSLSGSSFQGILQARILEWVAISFSRGIFLTQELNPGLLHCRQMIYQVSYEGSPTEETLADFIFLGSKITADGDCSHETKRRLLFGRKVMTNLDSIFKSRDITLPTKVRLVKVMVFLIVMYGCESWTIKKAERRRIDAFELYCWRRLLRVS